MSWNISNDGQIQCLDDGPLVPWWIDPADVERIDYRARVVYLRNRSGGPRPDADAGVSDARPSWSRDSGAT